MVTYEWDPAKAQANERKHGVTFVEASTAVEDDRAVIFDDGGANGRHIAIGVSNADRLLVVVHIERDGDVIRIISARVATKREAAIYREE